MDLTTTKPCIISCGVNGWYKAGVERLERSLIFNGYAGDMIMFKGDYPPNCNPHEVNPYEFKIRAFEEAFNQGAKIVMWCDASFWAIQNPMKILDIIVDKGVFAFRSGYNCAQTCPDNLLAAIGISRDEAEQIPETATGIVGINIDNPDGQKVFGIWKELCEAGLFKNDRAHNLNDSSDPRFLHGRQDQSAFSMALYKAGVSFLYQDYVAYYNTNYNPEKCIFFIGGL